MDKKYFNLDDFCYFANKNNSNLFFALEKFEEFIRVNNCNCLHESQMCLEEVLYIYGYIPSQYSFSPCKHAYDFIKQEVNNQIKDPNINKDKLINNLICNYISSSTSFVREYEDDILSNIAY